MHTWRKGVGTFILAAAVAALRAQEAPVLEFTDASLRQWVQAEYPADARKAKREGEVTVEFVVEPDGSVSRAQARDSTDPQFEAAALKAVGQWTFAPAVEEGKAVASAMEARVPFTAAQWKQTRAPLFPLPALMPRTLKVTPARVIVAPDPEYPEELADRKIPGEVQIEFNVDPEGRVREPKVLWASHAAFVESALRAIDQTRFEPARQGPLAKPTTKRYPVTFRDATARGASILAANQLEAIPGSEPAGLPQPGIFFEPVYPHERLLAGESGEATVEFTVAENGRVQAVRVTAASGPEFGGALQAAAEGWGFQPAMDANGVRISARLRCTHKFVPPVSGANARLVEAARPGGAGIRGAAGLDQRLKPLWRGFPGYPATLLESKPSGEAEVEFVIDRDGRVRLPRVKSATQEAFGWAAATAISQWVFERPRRGGEPVDVLVTIPVQFSPPAQ